MHLNSQTDFFQEYFKEHVGSLLKQARNTRKVCTLNLFFDFFLSYVISNVSKTKIVQLLKRFNYVLFRIKLPIINIPTLKTVKKMFFL